MSDRYCNEDNPYYDECPDEEPSDAEIAELIGEPIRKTKKKSTSDNKKSRAEKKCKIPVDYDPSPETDKLPEGHSRPNTKCHVDRLTVKPFSIGEDVPILSDHNVDKMSVKQRKFRFLASKCVSVGGEFYVKERDSGIWRPHKKPDAMARLQHDWIERTKFNITRQTVRDYFIENQYPVLHQTLYVPNGGDFLLFQGAKCLNTSQFPPASFDPDCIQSNELELLLRVINENLLNLPSRSINEILEDVFSDEATLTKWVFHWISSVYQNPGKHVGTSLWLIGSQQGVGKGLISSALIYLVGAGNGRKVNTKELGGEWNDFIAGNQLLIGDEIEMASKKGFNDMLKSYVANDVIPIRKRCVGVYNIPNVANWMFTTNKPKPITIDEDDRRNTFVATREDNESKTLARQFGILSSDAKLTAYQGLGALLANIDIDYQLISHAFDTPLKEQLKALSARPAKLWFKEDPFIQEWEVGSFQSSKTLYQRFRNSVADYSYHESVINEAAFAIQMVELAKKGYISDKQRKRLPNGSRPLGYVKLINCNTESEKTFDDDTPISPLNAATFDSARNKKARANIIQLRKKIKENR